MVKLIYFISAIALFLIMLAISGKTIEIMKIKHPNWKPPKPNGFAKIGSLATIMFAVLLPVFNTIMVFVYISNEDEIMRKAIKKLEDSSDFEG